VKTRTYGHIDLVLPDRSTWTIGHVLDLRARTHGDSSYLYVPYQDVDLTFAETRDLAAKVGRGLLETGADLGDRVLIMAPNRVEVMLAWLGSAVAGLVEVPINTAYMGAFLEHQVRTTSPSVAVIHADYADRFVSGDVSAYSTIRTYYLVGTPEEQAAGAVVLAAAGLQARPFEDLTATTSQHRLPDVTRVDTGAIFFTSGTTGLSKGVEMSHSQLCFVAQQQIALLRLTDEDTHMSVGPLFHGNAQFLSALPALIAGARFVLQEKFSASRWIDQIRDSGATTTNFIGVMMDWTHKQPERPDDADNRLRCVYSVPTPSSIVPDFSRRFGVDDFVEQYGMTEISMPILTPYGEPRPDGSAGLLVDEFFEAKIVDPATDEEVPTGQVGELVVRAKEPWLLLTSYFNMPDRTAEAMRNLWFHTGDGLRRDDEGWYYFVDRIKDAIRRRGENISSYEVEQALLRHETITDCAAVAVPADAEAGEDEVALFAVVAPGSGLTEQDVSALCEQSLPKFAVPKWVFIVDELPKTPSGKVQKVTLRARATDLAEIGG
jgi:crotonobetaine/carnitine-CoA ligase